MKLIVGLGNPTEEYRNTRHNIGFLVIDVLSEKLNIKVKKKECFSLLGKSSEIILAKPQTYMNSSGEAVVCLFKKFNIGCKDLIVISDDIDLPCGKLRIRPAGSSGGHKGIQSVIDKVNSREFYRLRIGINVKESKESKEGRKRDIIKFVLSEFTREEKKIIRKSIITAAEAVIFLINNSIESAMNQFNR